MDRALQILRDALEQHLIDRGTARLWALRGQGGAGGADAQRRERFLRSGDAGRVLAEVEAGAELAPEALQRLRDHLAWALQEDATAAAFRDFGAALARPSGPQGWLPVECLEHLSCTEDAALRDRALRALSAALAPQARAAMAAAWSAERDNRVRGGSALTDAERSRCRSFLEETAGPAAELLAFAARPARGAAHLSVQAVLHGLRAPALDAVFGARGRLRRMAGLGPLLRLSAPMARGLHHEPDVAGLWPGVVLPLAVPGDVRILDGLRAGGPGPELAGLWAVGVGLGAILCHGQLPFEDRWPLPAGVANALGGLTMQWLPDPVFLRHAYGVSGKALERAQRAAATAALWQLRLSCYWACVDPQAGDPLAEPGRVALGRALAVQPGPDEAWWFAAGPRAAHARALGQLAGLRLHAALRERFDEDYFRNPRVTEVLRGAAMRGNTLSGTELCTALDAAPDGEVNRVLEWL